MDLKENTTLSHVYGLASLIPGAVGIIAAVQSNAPWSTYALVISGWVAAFLYGAMLVKCFNQARDDSETIGRLKGDVVALQTRVTDVEALLEARNSTLDFVAGLKMGRTGVARAPSMKIDPTQRVTQHPKN